MEVFGKQHERVLVRQHNHVFLALAVGRRVPGERELHGGIFRHVGFARFRVHRRGSGQQRIDVEALQGGRHQTDGGKHRRASADPVLHRETGEEPVLLSILVELGSAARDGGGVAAEIESGRFEGGLRLQHSIAGFRGAAGLGNDEDQGLIQAGPCQPGEHRIHPGRVGVVEKVQRQPRVLADGFGHQLRPERGSADADEQDLLEISAARRGDAAGVDLLRELLEGGEWLGDGAPQLLGRSQRGIPQPIVADHAAFVGIGDRAGLDRRQIREGLLNARRKRVGMAGRDVHQRKVEGESVLRIADERLVIRLPRHGR